ncbi:MAG: hypothetical protein COA32_01520 [Fluviicola sp.]|nr:MAG: hypothetical protein COA32_01520 [Fluviicola sp.]
MKKIDESLTKIKTSISEIIEKVHFNPLCEFKLENCLEVIPWDDIKIQGLYLIEIKNDNSFDSFNDWLMDFDNKWSVYNGMFTPTLKLKRIEAHNELKEWIPIYLGKSQKISDRLGGHLNLELDKKTYALKLTSRTNLVNETFRLSIINLDVEHYDIIAPLVESALRNRINPLVGKQ